MCIMYASIIVILDIIIIFVIIVVVVTIIIIIIIIIIMISPEWWTDWSSCRHTMRWFSLRIRSVPRSFFIPYAVHAVLIITYLKLLTINFDQVSLMSNVCSMSLTEICGCRPVYRCAVVVLYYDVCHRLRQLPFWLLLRAHASSRIVHQVSDDAYDRFPQTARVGHVCLNIVLSYSVSWPPIWNKHLLTKFVVDSEFNQLLNRYTDPYHRARLLAAAASHSGVWLHTLPISACGLHLEDSAIRVAVGLRLGCAIFETHPCPCGATVDPLN